MDHLAEQFAANTNSVQNAQDLSQWLQDQQQWSMSATAWIIAAENTNSPTQKAQLLAAAAQCYIQQQQYQHLAKSLLLKAVELDQNCQPARLQLVNINKKESMMFVKSIQLNNPELTTQHTLAQLALKQGGQIKPLLIDHNLTGGTGLMNPSILPKPTGGYSLIIRHTNYTLYHSEKKRYLHPWGPLTYLHPEDDMHLRTINYYAELDQDLTITQVSKIDTSKFDTYDPVWTFVGLEDARLVDWEGQLYTTGVRRDTTPNGQGRMELCGIDVSGDLVTEVSRWRIPPPNDPNSYCEKNWMPVVDKPWHYVKWCNPTELVRVDPVAQTCETVHLGNTFSVPRDIRGGSQVIKWKNNQYIALTHEVDLFKSEVGRKDGLYRHRFVVWDENWNVVAHSDDFSIMGGFIEFAVGMCWHSQDRLLITFGFQDNAAYVLEIDQLVITGLLKWIN